MHVDQKPYVALYKAILAYEGGGDTGDRLFDEVVAPWLSAHCAEREWLRELARRLGDPPRPLPLEASWRLYALSRALDLLRLSFSPAATTGWRVAPVSRRDYERFLAGLGLERVAPENFHPFFHEIVAVEQLADPAAPPELVETLWPAARLGSLLIARAGCRIRSGRDAVVKEIAEGSTLYWAHARNHRPTRDLGDDWGSSSQWRAGFRQDHEIGGRLYYNLDADAGDGESPADLDADAAGELLRHRCFVRRAVPHEDRWPYDLSLIEPAPNAGA